MFDNDACIYHGRSFSEQLYARIGGMVDQLVYCNTQYGINSATKH